MVRLASVSGIITQTGSLIKAAIAAFALIAALSAFYITGKAIISVPGKLDQHDSVTVAGFRAFNSTLDRMLCIQIADHRKMDWRLCYINPAEVFPVDYQVK